MLVLLRVKFATSLSILRFYKAAAHLVSTYFTILEIATRPKTTNCYVSLYLRFEEWIFHNENFGSPANSRHIISKLGIHDGAAYGSTQLAVISKRDELSPRHVCLAVHERCREAISWMQKKRKKKDKRKKTKKEGGMEMKSLIRRGWDRSFLCGAARQKVPSPTFFASIFPSSSFPGLFLLAAFHPREMTARRSKAYEPVLWFLRIRVSLKLNATLL